MEWNEQKKEIALKTLLIVASVLYGLILVWVLWLKLSREANLLTNFQNISQLNATERFFVDKFTFKDPQQVGTQILEVILNCFILTPLGIALNLTTKGKKIWLHIIICFLFSFFIEILQYFTLIGGFSFIDLATNTLGYFIGLALYKLVFKKLSAKTLLILTSVCIVVFVGTLIYATISLINIKDTLNYIFSSI